MPPTEIPGVDVRVNGAPLPYPARTDLRSVTVEEDLDALSMFSLLLYNWDDERLAVSWSDSPVFAIGNEVEIWLGHLGSLRKVMVAEITGLEPAFTADEPSMLTVRGYDYRHRLARGHQTRTFSQLKDSAIASQVAREAGLRVQAKDTRTTLAHVFQSNQSDWEFLRRRASLIGYEVYVREKTLYFQPPQSSRPPAVRLSLGRDITEFTPRLSSLTQAGEVAVRGWDVKQKKAIVGMAGVGQESPMGGRTSGPAAARRAFGRAKAASVDRPVGSSAEADQIALGVFNGMALGYIRGDVTCAGHPGLRAGTVVDIDGAGRTFSGRYYVTSVTHAVSPELGYWTNLTVQRNAA